MSSLFSMDWTCCRCQHTNDSCTKCVCQHSYCHECADALGCVARGPATAIPHILPPQELVAPFATPRNSISLTSLTTTITTNNPVPAPSRRRFFPSISVQGRRRSKSPQHRKTSSSTPSIDEDFDKPIKVSRIDRWWIDL